MLFISSKSLISWPSTVTTWFLKDGKICDWKVYGLLKAHDGFRFTIKDKFLETPRIDDIFKPIELEENTIEELFEKLNGANKWLKNQ